MSSYDFQVLRRARQTRARALTIARWLLAAGLLVLGVQAAEAADLPLYECKSGEAPAYSVTDPHDLKVSGPCSVKIGVESYYGKVNIIEGGQLVFAEPTSRENTKTDFWASSIIIESGGVMIARSSSGGRIRPYGLYGGTLTIHLYGKNEAIWNSATQKFDAQNAGATCESGAKDRQNRALGPCGVLQDTWTSNGSAPVTLPGRDDNNKDIVDYFYQYGPLYGDGRCSDGTIFAAGKCGAGTNTSAKVGYFGNKVFAVSYGGALLLSGFKGAAYEYDDSYVRPKESDPLNSGWSWVRLLAYTGFLEKDDETLEIDRTLFNGDSDLHNNWRSKWQEGDEIVVTTTDYLPGHSERLRIKQVRMFPNVGRYLLDFEALDRTDGKKGVQWPHNGLRYGGARDAPAKKWTERLPERLRKYIDPELVNSGAETRAAVALLTRSIRIVSAGDEIGTSFGYHSLKEEQDDKKNNNRAHEDPNYSYGAHMVIRQGLWEVKVQGVEFKQMGQGGRLAHYPVHFHMARKTPSGTFIKDSAINESMTRWIVIHSTQGVTVARNVGYKSIGHGFYLEDGTETDNKFWSNVGIYSRGAVMGPDNPRNVPGILASNDPGRGAETRSDVDYPTVFWMANGWNEFIGNMAAGAGTCGACYWFVPMANSDMIEVQPMHTPMKHMNWSGYAGQQARYALNAPENAGAWNKGGQTPVKLFYKNYCSTAMHALNTTSAVSECNGVFATNQGDDKIHIRQVKSDAPKPAAPDHPADEMYYPAVQGNRVPTVCDPSIPNDRQGACTGPYDPDKGVNNNMAANVVTRCDNGDPKTCGMTLIDHFTTSFNWAETNFGAVWLRTPGWLMLDNSFISDVQNAGVSVVSGGDYSRSSAALGYWGLVNRSIFVGATQPSNSFAMASGPHDKDGKIVCDRSPKNICVSRADSVAYPLSNWATNQRLFSIYDGPAHQDSNAYLDIKVSDCNDAATCMYFGTPGVRKYLDGENKGKGYLPNGAIAWKQPNGFYYPPAFHSRNLFFDNVDIRHYVVQPLYQPGTYLTNDARVQTEFIGIDTAQTGLMNGFTDIDRQTVLNDDDGTLTGFSKTISVNEDAFFGAPIQTAQCKSDVQVDPDKACAGQTTITPPTARTSPYDFVTTVIYPGCAVKKGDKMPSDFPFSCGIMKQDTPEDAPKGRWSSRINRGGTWSRDCAGPFCFGVPIYRQYLTGKKVTDGNGKVTNASTREWLDVWYKNKCDDNPGKAECDFPFARMSGANEWQRDIMTINNGKFYIDTTRKAETQRHSEALGKKDDKNAVYVECDFKTDKNTACEPRSVNVFEENQTYYIFFLFAKATTRQTYQIYVGEGFNPQTGFKGVKITGVDIPFVYDDWSAGFNAANPKDSTKPLQIEIIEGPDKKKDILQVTVDFSKVKGVDPKVEFDPKKATTETCKPASFCAWKGSTCSTSLNDNDRRVQINSNLKQIAEMACNEWAVKDLDSPAGGRLGFAFTLPPGFKAQDQYKRPMPEAIDDNDPTWSKLIFDRTREAPDGAPGGACYYSDANTPGKGQCKVPD